MITEEQIEQWRKEVDGFFTALLGELREVHDALTADPTASQGSFTVSEAVSEGAREDLGLSTDRTSAQRLAELARRLEERLQQSKPGNGV